MKHFLLKFSHSVELGACLAYIGHAQRTGLSKIYQIATEELYHRAGLEYMLSELNEVPNEYIEKTFRLIGNTIKWLCKYAPVWSLNYVARTMELFAIFSYTKLAYEYPQWREVFKSMAEAEKDHEEYFKLGTVGYENMKALRKIYTDSGVFK